jgi:hypothetical protein
MKYGPYKPENIYYLPASDIYTGYARVLNI